MPISGSAEYTYNPNVPDVGSTTPGAIVPTKAIVLSNGNTLLGWTVTSPTGGITAMMQIFDPSGNAVGPAFAAPTESGGGRLFLDAVATSDGGFFAQISMSGEEVQYVRYDSAGVVMNMSEAFGFQGAGFEMQALPGGGLAVFAVDLIEFPNGDGTSAFDYRAVLRLFNAEGILTRETMLDSNAVSTGGGVYADLTVLPNGNIVAMWVEPLLVDFDLPSVHAQVFDSSGEATADAFVVDTEFGGFWPSIVGPAVEAFADGSFIMVWNGPAGTLFQLFNADGTAQSPITTLPTDSSYGADFANALITLPDMTFVIGQTEHASEHGDESGTAVVARQYNRDGTQVGEPITLNITGAGDQSSLHLVATPGGGFSALWLDYGDLTSISGSYEPDAVLDVWRRRDFSTGTVINAAPIAQDSSAAGNEDGSIAGQALAADANGDTLTYSLISGPTHGTLIFNANGSYVYTPNGDYNGADSFSFQANDGTAASNAATISLTVAAVNDGPTLANALIDQSSAEDAPFSFTVPAGSFADVDGDVLVLTATLGDGSALPSWISFDPATRTFAGTPPANFDGQIDVRVTAADGAGGSVSDQFTLDILPGNDAPTDLELSGTTVAENTADGTVVGTATAIDADSGDTRRYTLVDDAGGRFSIHAATGVLTVTSGALLNFEAASAHAVIIRVTDAAGLSYDESFSIAVTNANEAPDSLTLASGGSVAENSAIGTVVGQFAATDPDAGASLTYSLVDNAGGRFAINATTGQLTVANATLIDFEGAASHNVVVRATDQGGLSRDLTATIGVTDINEGTPLNEIEGTDRSDVLFGTGGPDEIIAGRGADLVFAGGGNDIVDGGLGNDLIDGGAGDDLLLGGFGRDILLGGIGNDVLIGGAGQDILTGGRGQDVFRFTDISESRPGGGTRDWITDFNANSGLNQDRIDLSQIDANTNDAGDQAFTFIGNAGFSGVAGQLRLGNNGRLQGDVNGDGLADFEVDISFAGSTPNPPLGPDIFIL